MSRARGDGLRRRVVGGVRLRGVAAEPALLRAVAGRARDRVLVFARQALHDLDAAVPRPGDGGGAGRRLAGRRRPRRLGAVAARRWRSAPGSAASTCSMPVRISSSIARTACDSIPVRFGVPRVAGDLARHARRRGRCACWRWRWSRRSAAVYLAGRRRGRGAAGLRAVAGPRRRSVAGEARLRSERLRRHPLSARAGGGASMAADSAERAPVDRDRRSPARAARSTRRGRWRRCSSAASTSSWSSRTTAGGCCATSSASRRRVDRLMPYPGGEVRRRRRRRHAHHPQQPRSRRDDRERQPRLRRHGDRAVLDEDAGRRRARPVAQPGRARRRRDAEGAAAAWSSCRARRR